MSEGVVVLDRSHKERVPQSKPLLDASLIRPSATFFPKRKVRGDYSAGWPVK